MFSVHVLRGGGGGHFRCNSSIHTYIACLSRPRGDMLEVLYWPLSKLVHFQGCIIFQVEKLTELLEHTLPFLRNLIGPFRGTKSLSCPQLRSPQLSCPLFIFPLLSSKLVRH